MEFDFWPAVFAGLVGGAVMSAMKMMMTAAGMDIKMDIARMWGTMMRVHGTAGRGLGMMIHLVVSAVIALIYAWLFDVLGIDDNLWLWGLIGGAVHWVIGGLFLAMVPPMHPEIPEQRPAPGMFNKNFGSLDVSAFLMGHLVYGLVVGVLYGWWHAAGGSDVVF